MWGFSRFLKVVRRSATPGAMGCTWRGGELMTKLVPGSTEHKRRFCETFIETHDPFDPEQLDFPDIDAESRQRLLSLPVWDEAVNTEAETARKVQLMADFEMDPLVRQAIALQGFEEGRHSRMLGLMTSRYAIEVKRRPIEPDPDYPVWEFTRTEYGECFDSFFAFGLFALARDSGFFPPSLVKLFDPIMQEEARHVLFFANWIAYRRARLPLAARPLLDLQRGVALALQIFSRVRTALDLGGANDQDNFAMKSHTSFGELSLRTFLQTCLSENERRLGPYDAGLLRPEFARRAARVALGLLPR